GAKRDDAEYQDGERNERRHHRALDECARQVHGWPSCFTASSGRIAAPGNSRNWPSVTTVSPCARPFSTIVFFPKTRPMVTGRISALLSSTTYTNGPCCPDCTASAGIVRAF